MKNINIVQAIVDEILEYIAGILDSIDSVSEEQFLANREKRQSVAMDIMQIGECSKRIRSENAKVPTSNPYIPWRRIYHFRDSIAHEYGELDFKIVWQEATLEIPKLKAQFEGLAKKLGKNNP